eukprot:6052211-Amphidinium_carterae.2
MAGSQQRYAESRPGSVERKLEWLSSPIGHISTRCMHKVNSMLLPTAVLVTTRKTLRLRQHSKKRVLGQQGK